MEMTIMGKDRCYAEFIESLDGSALTEYTRLLESSDELEAMALSRKAGAKTGGEEDARD